MQIKESQRNNRHIIYDLTVFAKMDEVCFDSAWYQQKGLLRGQAIGRGTTHFIEIGDVQCVLRHYRRGGLAAKLLGDQYVWSGIKNTRAWREWHLLKCMLAMDLPVPVPVAAQVRRKGLYYNADLITRRIGHSNALSAILQLAPIPEAVWRKLGTTIKQFHLNGVYHADLNAQNILIDSNKQIFLIDFDKGYLRNPRWSWQHQNLKRLLRSIHKSQQIFKTFYFTDKDWQILMDAYHQNSA